MNINEVLEEVEKVANEETVHVEDFDYTFWYEQIQHGLIAHHDGKHSIFGKEIVGFNTFLESVYFKECVEWSLESIVYLLTPFHVKLLNKLKGFFNGK